jgi:hypothetical protein
MWVVGLNDGASLNDKGLDVMMEGFVAAKNGNVSKSQLAVVTK